MTSLRELQLVCHAAASSEGFKMSKKHCGQHIAGRKRPKSAQMMKV
jgi:hypothetical protein